MFHGLKSTLETLETLLGQSVFYSQFRDIVTEFGGRVSTFHKNPTKNCLMITSDTVVCHDAEHDRTAI